jgi:S1-C subfamily serine protease
MRADGSILTNDHVIDGAEDISVDLGDRWTLKAKLVGANKPSDSAVLRIQASNLRVLSPRNSDHVRVGDVRLAVGNQLGIDETVTAGIISAKARQPGLSDGSFEDFLQTGMELTPITPDLANQPGLPRGTQGVAVGSVDPTRPAPGAGIQEGEVIQQVNGQPVRGGSEVQAPLGKTSHRPPLLQILCGGRSIFVAVPLR